MSHLDEGTLHALLDGELDGAEMRQIEAHLGRCTACGTRLDEVKSVRAEADRLIGSLGNVEAGRGGPAPQRAPAEAPAGAPAPEAWSGPVLLIPDPLDDTVDRQKRVRALGRVAAVLAVVGTGYLAFQSRGPARGPAATDVFIEQTRSAPPPTDAVLGPEESIDRPTQAAETAGTARGRAQPLAQRQPAPAASGADEDRADDTKALAAARAESAAAAAAAKAVAAEAAAELTRRRQSQATATRDTTRQSELDERTARSLRAAAATADVDRARQTAEREQPAPASPPPARPAPAAPPSLEERANVYLRIDLGEAKQQLGSPIHVIEGMSPGLIGLVQGRLSPGMDATRPVVRAVYLDRTNRLIFLDQQRLRPGQSPGVATQLRFVIGDVVVQLHGEPNVNVLRNLANLIR
jgi:hypothetical protein